MNGSTFELILPHSALLFDGHPIVEAEGLIWKLMDSDPELTNERLTFDLEVVYSFDVCLF